MKTIHLLIACLSLTSCAKPPEVVVDNELLPFIKAFAEEMHMNTGLINVTFAELEPYVLGQCESWSDRETKDIKIDPTYWATIGYNGKEQLMWHELGHCIMNLDHDNRKVIAQNQYVYGSMMNQFWFGDTWFYAAYRNNYKEAMRNNALMIP